MQEFEIKEDIKSDFCQFTSKRISQLQLDLQQNFEDVKELLIQ